MKFYIFDLRDCVSPCILGPFDTEMTQLAAVAKLGDGPWQYGELVLFSIYADRMPNNDEILFYLGPKGFDADAYNVD